MPLSFRHSGPSLRGWPSCFAFPFVLRSRKKSKTWVLHSSRVILSAACLGPHERASVHGVSGAKDLLYLEPERNQWETQNSELRTPNSPPPSPMTGCSRHTPRYKTDSPE